MHQIKYYSNHSSELYLLESLGYPLVNQIENENLCIPHKKVVFTDLMLWTIDTENPSLINDLSWADLVVCITCEVIYLDWDKLKSIVAVLYNNSNLIFISGGTLIKNYHSDKVFCPYLFFFMAVNKSNHVIDYSSNHNARPYLFDALLGADKGFRSDILNRLERLNLLDRSIAFLYDSNENNTQFVKYQTPGMELLEDPLILEWKHSAMQNPSKKHSTFSTSKKISSAFNANASFIISHKIYQNSWYSIVSETMIQDFFFLTEKVAKCLFGKRIFILFGAPGSLKFLRNQGFRTFEGIIDESYDLEYDNVLRFKKAFDQIKLLSQVDPLQIYSKAEEILEHNFKLITTGDLNLSAMKFFISKNTQNLE